MFIIPMNERTFSGTADRLRSAKRLALLDLEKIVEQSLVGTDIRCILDVGTGTGLFAEAFSLHGISATGIDIREDMLAEARKMVPAGNFINGSMEHIPFDDKAFDLVFLGHVLHEAEDPVPALVEARRAAKRRISVLEWPYIEEEQGPPILHRLSHEKVADASKKAGFDSVVNIQLKHMVLYRMDVL